jgi:hypothetical protein|mmetsp:Transcript_20434/g.32593  ORF Transcript_20434/g.32593 Transcript_20434/m.32593 type:complete len:97 (-) Transcript_20434:354-644(-)
MQRQDENAWFPTYKEFLFTSLQSLAVRQMLHWNERWGAFYITLGRDPNQTTQQLMYNDNGGGKKTDNPLFNFPERLQFYVIWVVPRSICVLGGDLV